MSEILPSHITHPMDLPYSRNDEYSPLQVRHGLLDPTEEDFPQFDQRVPQEPLPLKATLDEYSPIRLTYQPSDVCQLSCPGCYIGGWTDPNGSIRNSHSRIDTPDSEIEAHITAMGDGLQDVFYLGAEATLRPEMFHRVAKVAEDLGASVMSITNGASSIAGYEKTFRPLLDEGKLYKINLSLDSIDPAINNRLRGRDFAHMRTVETIRHALEKGDPIKVNITVWPDNYHTILDTAQSLVNMGVTGLGFHCGSIEGIPDQDKSRLVHLDPLAWRALCSQLLKFREQNRNVLNDFTLPFIFFNEKELAEGIIGDEEAYKKYKAHLENVENGSTEPNPIKVCPALGVPQVYIFGNDGKNKDGAVSLCNLHTMKSGPDGEETYLADFDSETSTFVIEQDPSRNQLTLMQNSPHLCPARPQAIGDDNPSDRIPTAAGDVYNACRYVSANQFPYFDAQFGSDHYEEYVKFYQIWSEKVAQPIDFVQMKTLHSSDDPLTEKIDQLRAL